MIEVGKHENKNDAFKAFKSDDGAKEAMTVLDGRCDANIVVQLNSVDHRIYVCESFDCNRIMIKEKRDHNSDYCRVCQKKKWNKDCSDKIENIIMPRWLQQKAKLHSIIYLQTFNPSKCLLAEMRGLDKRGKSLVSGSRIKK